MDPDTALAYARRHRSRLASDLGAFVRFPSVSSDPARSGDVRECAAWLAGRLRTAGFDDVGVIAAPGPPIVRANWHGLPRAPTLLLYGHYDVQPAGARADWRTSPFDLVQVGDRLHGRGASDDKGPIIAHILALESWLRRTGALPVNVRCIFEGEEEIGSPALRRLLLAEPSRFRSDAVLVSDTRIPSPDQPAITYSLRGSMGLEVEVSGGRSDLHAGAFGGAVGNPIEALCRIVGRLHDADGRVAIPGFYHNVRRWPPSELAFMANNGPSNAEFVRATNGAPPAEGPGASLYERVALHPALSVTGVVGGHRGPGAGAHIPHQARATLNVRLAPDQDPTDVAAAIRRHLLRSASSPMRFRMAVLSASRPITLDRRHPVLNAAATACRRGFGSDPVWLRSGGTIPVIELFVHRLGLPVVLFGLALPDDGMHAPNERAHLPTLTRGVDTAIWFLWELGRLGRIRPPRPSASTGRSMAISP